MYSVDVKGSLPKWIINNQAKKETERVVQGSDFTVRKRDSNRDPTTLLKRLSVAQGSSNMTDRVTQSSSFRKRDSDTDHTTLLKRLSIAQGSSKNSQMTK